MWKEGRREGKMESIIVFLNDTVKYVVLVHFIYIKQKHFPIYSLIL